MSGQGSSSEARSWADSRGKEKQQQVVALQAAQALALQGKALKATEEVAAYSKGTGSYCYFEPTVSSKRHGAIGSLANTGRPYPLYDLRFRVVPDPHERIQPIQGKASYQILEEVMRVETHAYVGTLAPSNTPGIGYPSVHVKWDLPNEAGRSRPITSSSTPETTSLCSISPASFASATAGPSPLGSSRADRGGEEGAVLMEFVHAGIARETQPVVSIGSGRPRSRPT